MSTAVHGMTRPEIALSLREAGALALVLHAAEADSADPLIVAALGDALDLLQDATARSAEVEHATMI